MGEYDPDLAEIFRMKRAFQGSTRGSRYAARNPYPEEQELWAKMNALMKSNGNAESRTKNYDGGYPMHPPAKRAQGDGETNAEGGDTALRSRNGILYGHRRAWQGNDRTASMLEDVAVALGTLPGEVARGTNLRNVAGTEVSTASDGGSTSSPVPRSYSSMWGAKVVASSTKTFPKGKGGQCSYAVSKTVKRQVLCAEVQNQKNGMPRVTLKVKKAYRRDFAVKQKGMPLAPKAMA